MKSRLFLVVFLTAMFLNSCGHKEKTPDMKIIFLHHSVGNVIWNGNSPSLVAKAARRISNKLAVFVSPKAQLPHLFEEYNKSKDKAYLIEEKTFPKEKPYGWNNFPYDYYNIWVKNAGEKPYMEEPTLEMLTRQYQVIIFKHCYPVSSIHADTDSSDINSDIKTISNYKLQYTALKEKLHQFPDTKFILFTGAAQVKSSITEAEAIRAREFFDWVIREWDIPGDNIYLWDLYSLETKGGLYLVNEYAVSPENNHPNDNLAGTATKLLFQRIIDVIENNGSHTRLTGEST